MRSTKFVFASVGAAVVAILPIWIVPARATDAKPGAKAPAKEALVELGRRLFMDPAVSRLGKNSCASCHDPERGFSDPRPSSADDAGPTRRHSQTLIDLAGDGFHWDGEFDTVRQLLVARVAPPDEAARVKAERITRRTVAARRERGKGDLEFAPPATYYGDSPGGVEVTPVAARLVDDGRYAEAFTATFGSNRPTTDQILDAMDAYCGSIRSATNAYDRFRAGDAAALSASAQRGLALFEGRAGCAQCHLTKTEGGRAPFTDGKFHDTGLSTRRESMEPASTKSAAKPDLGLEETTFVARNSRKFKTPTLRDVALRAPYMHDASRATLADVVAYYSAGGAEHEGLDPAMRRLDLTEGESADLVTFLESLTGVARAGLGFSSPAVKPLKVRIVGLDGAPMRGFWFAVEAFGDRLLGETPERAPASATTDDDGFATFERPLATHVLLTSPEHVLELSRPIPDTCASRTLIATPRETISLRLRRAPSYPGFPDEVRVFDRQRGWDKPPVATLKRVRGLGADEVLYAGPGIRDGESRACVISVDHEDYTATVPLSGGTIEPIALRH